MAIKQSSRGIRLAITAIMLPVLGLTGVQSYAQAGMLEEVVVVARKREESLQDTPVAVSAFNPDQMRAAQIENIADLAQQVPGLSNKDGDRISGITIRGVGARAVGAAVDPGVGVYVDGIFMPRSDTQLVDVVDMESIQVLRGPQGTLFGKNTAGGALLLRSKKPSEEFAVQVNATLGDYDRQDLGIRIEGPLIEGKLLGALTYDTRNEDGYMDDYYTDIDYGDTDRQAVVGQLRYMPTDNLTIDMIALWGERKENAAPYTCTNFNPAGRLQSLRSTTPGVFDDSCSTSESVVKKEKVVMDSTGLEFEVTNKMAGLTVDWAIGDVTLKSVTGYLKQDDLKRDQDIDATDWLSISNFDETIRQLEGSGIDGSSEQREFISQEFNLFGSLFDDAVDYTFGIYGSDESIDDQVDGRALSLGGWMGLPVPDSTDVQVLPPAVAGLGDVALVNLTSTSAAAFGQLIYNYSEMWQFTVGGRWTWEEKKIDQDNFVSTAPGFFTVTREEMNAFSDFLQPIIVNPEFPKLKDDDDWTEFTPTATVTMFAPDSWTGGFLDSAMFYLTYSEGFKAGGFSAFGPDLPLAFDPETVKNTEFGFKMEMLDQRLRLNGAIYSMDYDDMQLGVTRNFGFLDTRFGITNAGQAEMQGVELELVMAPLDGLLINLTGSYIDASYNEFDDEFEDTDGNIQQADRSDEPFAYLPEQTYSWAVQYDWNTKYALITPRVSGYYKDKIYLGMDVEAFAFEDDATLDDYTVWNARLAIAPTAVEGLEIAVYAQNFTDEFYYGTGTVNAFNIGAVSAIRGKPRNYGVEFYYNW